MKRGNLLRVSIERLAPDGTGYTEVEGRKLQVKGALPGDEVDVRILALKRHSARVKLESIMTPGVERIPAKCPHFSQCGGCQWQDVPYTMQCAMKAELVWWTLSNIPGIDPFEDVKIIPSPDEFFYRNKMEFSFDSPLNSQGEVMLGLHESGRFDRVFDLRNCFLQSEFSNRAVESTRAFVNDHRLTAYGLKSHSGLLRFLVVRDGKNTGELMIHLVTSGEDFTEKENFVDHIVRDIPHITTVVRSINRRTGSVAVGEECEILFGNGFIKERIGDFTFRISPDSFFQTNTCQAENLYETIKDFSGLTGTEHLLDLYSGTGTIGIYLAENARAVTGIEIAEIAVADARKNAEMNGIENISFLAGKVEKIIDESMGPFNVVICDPPRTGIHPKALARLLRMRIPRMVYVSCNLKAMPHDLEMLAMAGYRIKDVRVFDMSPHTPHVETVLLLKIG